MIDRRLYPANEPLPPRDRVAYLESRIRCARDRISILPASYGRVARQEVQRLRSQIAEWRRELEELRS